MRSPTAATRLFAVLGDPVSHSLSPAFQNAAMRAAGLDAVYVALRCTPPDVGPLLRGIARAGGGGNVTVPHKERAAAAVERCTPLVERTGACNTFWLQDGEIWGDNTDVEGVRRSIHALCRQAALRPGRVLLLGAGGAASAVLVALEQSGTQELVVVSRTPERGRRLCARFADSPVALTTVPAAEALGGQEWDLVVNATPIGLHPGEQPPLAGERFAAALDLVYAPGGTSWVRALRRAGIPAQDGSEMLLQQGAAAFACWFGREPDLTVMRAVLGAALGTVGKTLPPPAE